MTKSDGKIILRDKPAAKFSVSLPAELENFLNLQCVAFGVGRSAYLQLLLDAEMHSPRKHFVKRSRENDL